MRRIRRLDACAAGVGFAHDPNAERLVRPFTLIELLVVIAVIAILASLLLPVLGSAKETGKRAYCANTLKQCGYAAVQYVDDYNGYIADCASPSVNSEGGWHVKLAPYFGIDPKPTTAFYNFKPSNNPVVRKYFCCMKRPQGNFNGNTLSYFVNNYTSNGTLPRKLIEFQQPSGKVYLADATDSTTSFTVGNFSFNRNYEEAATTAATVVVGGCIQLRHLRMANFVFLDGRVGCYGASSLPVATWSAACNQWLRPDYSAPDNQ